MPISQRSSQAEYVSRLACAFELAEVWTVAAAAVCWCLHYFLHIPTRTFSWFNYFGIPLRCLKAKQSWHSWGYGCVWPHWLQSMHQPRRGEAFMPVLLHSSLHAQGEALGSEAFAHSKLIQSTTWTENNFLQVSDFSLIWNRCIFAEKKIVEITECLWLISVCFALHKCRHGKRI